MIKEVLILKHLVLIAYVVLRLARQSLLHHARFKCEFSRRAAHSRCSELTCILTERITWIVYRSSQSIALTRGLEVRIALLVLDVSCYTRSN